MIKEVTSFKVKPEYVTAIQVLPTNIDSVSIFCPIFHYFKHPCYEDIIGYLYDNTHNRDNNSIEFYDFIVKDKSGYKVVSDKDFYNLYDRAEE